MNNKQPIYGVCSLQWLRKEKNVIFLTKYVVGAKANPPKKPRRPPKKGIAIPTIIVNPAVKKN